MCITSTVVRYFILHPPVYQANWLLVWRRRKVSLELKAFKRSAFFFFRIVCLLKMNHLIVVNLSLSWVRFISCSIWKNRASNKDTLRVSCRRVKQRKLHLERDFGSFATNQAIWVVFVVVNVEFSCCCCRMKESNQHAVRLLHSQHNPLFSNKYF